MTIKEIKKILLKWEDHYGQDIANQDCIKNANSKKELKAILEEHRNWLENQNIDALQNIDNLIKELDLDYY